MQGHGADSGPLKSGMGQRMVGLRSSCPAAAAEMSFPATLESVPQAIEFAKCHLEEFGYSPKVQMRFAMIIDEIASNIAKYAYEAEVGDFTIRLSAERDGRVAGISFIDGGIAFNPLDAPRTDPETAVATRQIGGQGIIVVKKLADEIEYERKDGKNILFVRMNAEQ